MANSDYEYVRKDFETIDKVMEPNLIVLQINGRNFQRFSEAHEFEKPNDERSLNLMNACAAAVLAEFPDVVFAYGFCNEYSFFFKKDTNLYKRRASKILSIIVSFFTSIYMTKWSEFFPHMKLRFPPSFRSRIICCATVEVLQTYLMWRQTYCHNEYQQNVCFCTLIKSGKSEEEAQDLLKVSTKEDRNEILFKHGINYKNLPVIFRQGSCLLRTKTKKRASKQQHNGQKKCDFIEASKINETKIKTEDTVDYRDDCDTAKKERQKTIILHSEKIASRGFWNEHDSLKSEISCLDRDLNTIKPQYVESFQFENNLMKSTWIVVRIDGCHFHRFSEVHEFEKPNDECALNLMNSCAVSVVEEFNDVVFAYGVSDEYSFVLKKDSQLYQRCVSGLVSAIVSFFTSMYVMKWKEYFPNTELKRTPYFDGRAVCYPSYNILRDYLTWRQIDCHINNHYNTCFWMLVKSGKSKSKAQDQLKGTQKQQKNDILEEFGIKYDALPDIFRHGTSVFCDKEETSEMNGDEGAQGKTLKKIVVEHCNIIKASFWEAHPNILEDKL